MRTKINLSKYNNKWNLHTIDESGSPAQERDVKEIEAQNKIKEVCLNCTKKKCRGTKLCFEKERNKND